MRALHFLVVFAGRFSAADARASRDLLEDMMKDTDE